MPEFTNFQCENARKNFALFCTYSYREYWSGLDLENSLDRTERAHLRSYTSRKASKKKATAHR